MEVGQVVIVQPLSLNTGEITLLQDEALEIIEVTNSTVTFVRLVDGTVNEISKYALQFAVE